MEQVLKNTRRYSKYIDFWVKMPRIFRYTDLTLGTVKAFFKRPGRVPTAIYLSLGRAFSQQAVIQYI